MIDIPKLASEIVSPLSDVTEEECNQITKYHSLQTRRYSHIDIAFTFTTVVLLALHTTALGLPNDNCMPYHTLPPCHKTQCYLFACRIHSELNTAPNNVECMVLICPVFPPPQEWSGAVLPQGVWLQPRRAHTAHSLWDPDSDPEDPCLVVTCGRAADGTPLGDTWILSVNSLTSAPVSA